MIDPRKPDYRNTPANPARPAFGYTLHDASAPPLVSVITPFFNGGPVFHETARCVLHQSLQQWEWIIVNDRSTDPGAIAVLAEYRSRDPRIRVIDAPENRGPSAARNQGVAAARCEFIFQLDSDDLIEPTILEKFRWFLETHPECAFVGSYSVGFGDREYLWSHGFNSGRENLRENLTTIMAMLRKRAFEDTGGYTDSIRDGMEDWQFWLSCAERGHWGRDIPEYLSWYRRRVCHGDRWSELKTQERRQQFRADMLTRFPRLTSGSFPEPVSPPIAPLCPPTDGVPGFAPLRKTKQRLLMIVPWLRMGGADKFNLDLVAQLTARGWEVTIATTLRAENPWAPDFSRFTPDIFFLHTFLRRIDYPAFLKHLIDTRRPDVVMVSNSELGYQLLPYLRANCRAPAYVDYCHMEEENWKNGGYPRYGVGSQELLDLNIVASEHLKRWMSNRGADASRIDVAYINVDTAYWKPDDQLRAATRTRLGIDENTTVILYAARLCPQKRPLIFARILDQLRQHSGAFLALIAGDGEDGPAMRRFVEEHGLSDHVRFLGEIPASGMRELVLASDIFLLPSEWEGIALSIYEAMAAGVVVVGADVGGQRELVVEGCGWLIPHAAEELEIRQYVATLVPLIADPAARRKVAVAARQRVAAHFELSTMGERMNALLARAIELRDRSQRPVVSPGLALETATQAIEFARVTDNLDELWRLHVARRDAGAPPAIAAPILDEQTMAESELLGIENSRFWKTLQALKRIPPYGLVARLRFGPHWDRPTADPRERLAQIKRSNAYRLIQSLKHTGLYRWYATRKYGPGAAGPPISP